MHSNPGQFVSPHCISTDSRTDQTDAPSTQFTLMMHMADRFMSRGWSFGIAAVQATDLPPSLVSHLIEVVARTTEFVAWGRCGSLYGALLSKSLLNKTMPLCRLLMREYSDLRAGIAFGCDSVSAADVWIAARSALETAATGHERLVILGSEGTANRLASLGIAHPGGMATDSLEAIPHDTDEGRDTAYRPLPALAGNTPSHALGLSPA